MDRRVLTLFSLSLACGSAEPVTDTRLEGSAASGGETVTPAEVDPHLETLVELAESDDRRADALALAQQLRAELSDATDGRREAVADAMGRALLAIEGTAGVDNRLRIELLRGLGETAADAARAPLTVIARRLRSDQNFLINRLALEKLAERREEANIPVLIDGLFLCAPANPAMRMDDIAVSGLARLGEPAVQPLLQVLEGTHPTAPALVRTYIDLVREREPQLAPAAERVLVTEALFALGLVGHRSAFEPLLARSRDDDALVRLGAVIALVSLRPVLEDGAPIRDALTRVYEGATEVQQQVQLLASARRLGDPELLPFLLAIADDGDLDPSLRLTAGQAYALIAPPGDHRTFGRLQRSRDLGEHFAELAPLIAETERCDGLVCWIQAFQEHAGNPGDPELARKAAMQIGQLGRGEPRAITALVAQLGHRDVVVRLAALRALDSIAIHGSPAAVQRIDSLRESEEGRAIWTQFSREALPIQGRLIARGR